jgi:membrane protease subunit HflK
MAEKDKQNDKDLKQQALDQSPGEEFNAADKSLSEALGISFIILKVIIIVLLIAFLASGFKTVDSDEQALVLRFGKIRGVGENRILKPRTTPYWVFPYPVDTMVKIPVQKKIDLSIRSFWYYQTQEDMLRDPSIKTKRVLPTLDPVKDGYCITRSESQDDVTSGPSASDYNIVHCKWQLTYQINDPERFFKNVYIEDVKPGDIYFDVITESIKSLLQNVFEDVIVTAMVNYTIDDVMFKQVARLTENVRKLLQEKLDTIESGIKVVQVQLTDKTWPMQVDEAFQASVSASQTSERAIDKARTEAENSMIEASALVKEKIAEAQAYRTTVVADAKAQADYLRELLPEYRKYPELVIQQIYQDAMERILNNVDEKFVVPKGTEWRVLLNRDPTLKRKADGQQKTQGK